MTIRIEPDSVIRCLYDVVDAAADALELLPEDARDEIERRLLTVGEQLKREFEAATATRRKRRLA